MERLENNAVFLARQVMQVRFFQINVNALLLDSKSDSYQKNAHAHS